MKRIGLILALTLIASGQIFGQNQKLPKQPDEKITVNKKYDDNGNLLQYDSTYVHRWSSDSTFRVPLPDENLNFGRGFPDLDEYLNNYMNDSTFGNFYGNLNWKYSTQG